MTALNLNVSLPHNSVAKSNKPSSKLRLRNRRGPSRQLLRTKLQSQSELTLESTKGRSTLLSSLRRNYASRGLSAMKPASVSVPLSSDCKESAGMSTRVSPECSRNVDLLISASELQEPVVNISDTRRSVSLLKLPVYCGMTDIQTDDDSCSSADSDDDIQSKVDADPVRKYRIQFKCYVKVAEIPHHDSYSPTQRSQMWNNSKTLRGMAKVNRIEYNWEGTDWQNAPEEDEFCSIDGKIIHPAHLL
jgi:hypothetical protein